MQPSQALWKHHLSKTFPSALRSLRRKVLPLPRRRAWRGLAMIVALMAVAGALGLAPSAATTATPHFSFPLTVSAGAAACLPDARGEVVLSAHGPVQQMIVRVAG